MGIGPSSKETTLHHFNDPLVETISGDREIDFLGIAVQGTPEVYSDKRFNAQRCGALAEAMRADGVIVSIDSWGNSHIDFASVLEEIGKRAIPTVGLSFVGNQASFVVTNPYMETIIDLNKNTAGIETRVVGENTASEMDAKKAVALLKNKIRKKMRSSPSIREPIREKAVRKLTMESFAVHRVSFSERTEIENEILFLNDSSKNIAARYRQIETIRLEAIYPDQQNQFVNSILDFSPVAVKVSGKPGEGVTRKLSGLSVMLTGVEVGGFQAANIGSSEGILAEHVKLLRRGTPSPDDIILHVDVVLKDGQARTREGITAAHRACDEIVQQIRQPLKRMEGAGASEREEFYDFYRIGGKKVLLVKLVPGLGCMYDTGLFPCEPGGCMGCRSVMDLGNMPVIVSPNEYRDGAVCSFS
jgi:hypothetical protein